MFQKIVLSISLVFILSNGINSQFKVLKPGMEYLIMSNGQGEVMKPGEYFEIEFQQLYNGNEKDTVLYDSRQHANQIAKLDSAAMPKDYYIIFSKLRRGDSLVVKQITDSVANTTWPPFMEKGHYLTGHYRIVNIYYNQLSADSASLTLTEKSRIADSIADAGQLLTDKKIIEKYLKEKNIKTIKSPLGTYVEIIKPGIGDLIQRNQTVKVFYTGKSIIHGKAFDSNIDSSFHHTEIFSFAIPPKGEIGKVIKGWEDGFFLLRKGAEAVLYIPSVLAYGKSGQSEIIGPDENIFFYVKVIDVLPVNKVKSIAKAKVPVKKNKIKK